jgi:hypothetical protein
MFSQSNEPLPAILRQVSGKTIRSHEENTTMSFQEHGDVSAKTL